MATLLGLTSVAVASVINKLVILEVSSLSELALCTERELTVGWPSPDGKSKRNCNICFKLIIKMR